MINDLAPVQTPNIVAAKDDLKISAAMREELLRPLPKIRAYTLLLIVLVAGIYLWGLDGTDARPSELVQGIPNIVNFIVRLMPPALEMEQKTLPLIGSISFPTILTAIVETLQMAIIGSSISILLSVPFGLLAARNITPNALVYQTTRIMLNIIRAIPELIWALIFVAAVGLGPFGGVLALGVGSIGSLAKLYAESIEAIDPQQVLALRATGATPLQVFIYSVVPQALPVTASYSLLSFESNVRAATILGLVGAGGVGFILQKYMALFQYHRLTGAVILLAITVTVIDRASAHLRKKMI
jgi:phosphonate transport system permease protein